MSGPAVGSPAYNNQSIGWKLVTTDLVTIIFAFLLVVGRLYTKCFLTKSPGWEDCNTFPSHICVPLRLIPPGIGASVLAFLIAVGRVVGDLLSMHQRSTGLLSR